MGARGARALLDADERFLQLRVIGVSDEFAGERNETCRRLPDVSVLRIGGCTAATVCTDIRTL